ncbi:hypothetical protein ACOME3_005527 [Neoechinorhynchus agilis]
MEDEVIERRLIFEGDSGTDDRRYQTLMTHLLDAKPISKETIQLLENIQFCFERCEVVLATNERDQDCYEKLSEQMQCSIEEGERRHRQLLENDLKEAKQVLANRREYEVLEKQLEKLPSKEMMEKKMASLQNKLEKRRKRCTLKAEMNKYCRLTSIAMTYEAEQLKVTAIGGNAIVTKKDATDSVKESPENTR